MTDGLEALQQAEAKARAAVGRWPSDEPPEWWAQYAHLLDAYAEAVRATERASASALRAAAQEALRQLEDNGDLGHVMAETLLHNALDGAPWEPSEEQVERAAEALYVDSLGKDHGDIPVWEKSREQPRFKKWARAALKAAMGIESQGAG